MPSIKFHMFRIHLGTHHLPHMPLVVPPTLNSVTTISLFGSVTSVHGWITDNAPYDHFCRVILHWAGDCNHATPSDVAVGDSLCDVLHIGCYVNRWVSYVLLFILSETWTWYLLLHLLQQRSPMKLHFLTSQKGIYPCYNINCSVIYFCT